MPNWCNNYLSISGPEEDIARFRDEVKDKDSSGNDMCLSFNKHVSVWDGTNLIKDKDPIEDWGTKWNAEDSYEQEQETDDCLVYSFETAWAPPCAWLEVVVGLFPTLDFEMEYEEGGCDVYGVSTGSKGEFSDKAMSKVQYLEENNDDYQDCVKSIKDEMTQEELIKLFSGIKNFIEYIQEEEEGHDDPSIPMGYDFWPLAGTIIEAIEAKNLPLFINVDWGDEYNTIFKNRMREGK